MTQVLQEQERTMPLPLDSLQSTLDRHFRDLANSRAGSGLPLFAFEHGLNSSQIEELSLHLRARLASGGRLSNYWLLWVVYAAEIGYGYTGEEYWHSFEEKTLGWELHHRDALRDWYRKFQKTYRGVQPSGPWADHFPIIAWPITHAILPKYLQYQFARAIYQNRFRLASLGALDPRTMGRLLAAYTDDPSKRFQQFLQQEELTGRILLGLLGEMANDASGPIYPSTLQRIVADLDAVRATRAWLKDVRTVVAKFKGIGQGRGPSVNHAEDEIRNRRSDATASLDIRPRIFLRHSGAGNWAVGIAVPNLSPVAALKAELGAILRATRTKVAGSTDTKPAGWVLSPNRVAIVKSWPASGTALLQVEKSHPVLDALLISDFTMSAESLWLFRIGSDGIASEIVSRTVRPGADYILLTTNATPSVNGLSTTCAIECSGIFGCRLSLPSSLSAAQTKLLTSAGLQVARTIRVWPAGLPRRGWDGEGQSEWLTTDEPCLGLVHDHPVSAFLIRLNGVTQGVVNAPAPGVPTFVRLNPLPAGRHRLAVTAQRQGSIADINEKSPTDGFLDLFVREPEPWVPGVSAHTGLIVTVDPHDADLEDFWTGKVDISVVGPASHQVSCVLTLERPSGEEIVSGQVAMNIPLPLTAEGWRKKFESFVEREESTTWRYPEASVGRVRIQGGELGEFALQFHRDVQPLRWLTRRANGRVLLKLADDTGLSNPAECESFSMNCPAVAIPGDVTKLRTETELEPPGALYVARNGAHTDALIVSYGLTQDGLHGLGVRPSFEDVADDTVSLKTAILTLDLWSSARLAGPLVEIRRRQVTRELTNAIFARVCGNHWGRAERTFLENPKLGSTVDALLHKVCAHGGFGVVIQRDHVKFLGVDAVDWYAALSQRFKICTNRTLCEFAFRLAFEPQKMSQVYGSRLDELTKESASNPEVVRGARFGALLCAAFSPSAFVQFERGNKWL